MPQPKPRHVLVVRYFVNGREVPKITPGAKPKRFHSHTYYATIHGKRHSLKTTDLGEAWAALKALQRRLGEEEAGIRDPYVEQARRPLSEHIAEWLDSLRHRGTGDEQIATMGARVRLLADLAGWKRVNDLTASSLLAVLSRLVKEPGLTGHGRGPTKGGKTPLKVPASAQTRNHYLSHAKQFARWCTEHSPRRLREHPFLGLRPVSVEEDRRHDRRVPTGAEVAALFAVLPQAPDQSSMTGPQRALGYKVSMATGFRADELRSLSRESFDLDAGTVIVRAAYSKRRRRDTQQLPGWLTAELLTWFTGGGGTWEGFPENYPGRILQADLKRAGVVYVVNGPDGPLFFDFHSLRAWYCTAIANQPGMSPKTMLELCRHSTPALTLKIYAAARRDDLRAAVDLIPDPSPPKP